ncbi:MAG TPA: 4Fe-4S binding protein [Methanocorpusculum sp.]|nr:4Fe-4S binding protein [Methanocorpusculum sp.]
MKTDSQIYTKGGIITESDGDNCTVRLRMPAGNTTYQQLVSIAEIAKKYGTGEIHLTTRQTIEIPHVPATKLPELYDDLIKTGNDIGAERGEVVNITACPGTDRCKFANIDTIKLAKIIDQKYFCKDMPGKVRIAISGCPNSCMSETLNEIGVTGICTPIRKPDYCTGCGTCVQYCQENAICVVDGRITMNIDKCLDCGTCIRSCIYGIIDSKPVSYRITIGGRRGRHPKVGMPIITVNTLESAINTIDAIVDWIYRYASFDKPVVQQIGNILDLNDLKISIQKRIPIQDIE